MYGIFFQLPGLESLATLSGHKGEITDITTHTSKQVCVCVRVYVYVRVCVCVRLCVCVSLVYMYSKSGNFDCWNAVQ